MSITVLSPHDGTPVKLRDQDLGRAVRDAQQRIFYVLPRPDGSGHYAALTRAGGTKDLQRYDEMLTKTQQVRENVHEQVAAVTTAKAHDARGKRRGKPLRWFLLLLILLGAAAGTAWYLGLLQEWLP